MQEQISQSKQQLKDRKQDKHRTVNTILISLLLLAACYSGVVVTKSFNRVDKRFEALTYEEHKTSELAQLVKDEGYKKCIYDDSRGLQTIGFGHLMLPTDTFKCLSSTDAVSLLRKDYTYAENSVDTRYSWAEGEVRLVLINMTYQMGVSGVSKFRITLQCLKVQDYDCAASELLDSRWASQTPCRAARLAGRFMAIPIRV